MKSILTVITLGVFIIAGQAHAGVDPVLKCKEARGKATGLKAFTLMNAFAKNIKKPNQKRLTDAISKAESEFTKQFTAPERKGWCNPEVKVNEVEAKIISSVDCLARLAVYDERCPLPPALPATGQTTCWDSGGLVIPCAGTGHDGDIRAGAPLAYMDNGDGTITDLNTGLMWEKKSDDGSIHDKDNTYTWDNAFAVHVAGLNSANFAGRSDWRVPNVRELHSIVNYELSEPGPTVSPAFNTNCTPGCSAWTCSCTASSWSFSSTTGGVDLPDYAWLVLFGPGVVARSYKSDELHVRAVRGGL